MQNFTIRSFGGNQRPRGGGGNKQQMSMNRASFSHNAVNSKFQMSNSCRRFEDILRLCTVLLYSFVDRNDVERTFRRRRIVASSRSRRTSTVLLLTVYSSTGSTVSSSTVLQCLLASQYDFRLLNGL